MPASPNPILQALYKANDDDLNRAEAALVAAKREKGRVEAAIIDRARATFTAKQQQWALLALLDLRGGLDWPSPHLCDAFALPLFVVHWVEMTASTYCSDTDARVKARDFVEQKLGACTPKVLDAAAEVPADDLPRTNMQLGRLVEVTIAEWHALHEHPGRPRDTLGRRRPVQLWPAIGADGRKLTFDQVADLRKGQRLEQQRVTRLEKGGRTAEQRKRLEGDKSQWIEKMAAVHSRSPSTIRRWMAANPPKIEVPDRFAAKCENGEARYSKGASAVAHGSGGGGGSMPPPTDREIAEATALALAAAMDANEVSAALAAGRTTPQIAALQNALRALGPMPDAPSSKQAAR